MDIYTRRALCLPSRIKTRSVGQITVGQALLKHAYNLEKIKLVVGFCCVDFITGTRNICRSQN